MTEAEARVVGLSAIRIAQLRSLRHDAQRGGTLTLHNANVALCAEDVQACLSILIEREAALLAGFNVALAEPVS